MKIDGHIHFAEDMGAGRLERMMREQQLSGAALLCIPKGGERPVEEDAFAFQRQCGIPVWIFGGIDRSVYDHKWQEGEEGVRQMAESLSGEIKRLLDMGCTGIKMLEGKPDVRKKYAVPDFDSPVWEPYWAELEKRQIPVIMHVNDPAEFWDEEKISEHAKKAGWFYDKTYIDNEAQYTQLDNVLVRHPRLRILFPHFYFLAAQLPRLEQLLERYPNVYLDLTPGAELYFQLSAQRDAAARFFETYQDRICYGTDIGARSVIWKEKAPLSPEECRGRVDLITRFLETEGMYIQEPDGSYLKEGKPVMMTGLGLSKEKLDKVYADNFLIFIKEKGKLNGER